MRYYLIAGEASGDLHAANLILALQKSDESAIFRGWGGDRMEAAGAVLVKHYRDLAYMGFFQVIMHLPAIKRNLSFCERDIRDYKPDVLILIDYPGFNLRMAKFAARNAFRVFYYITPQLWAWRSSRVKILKKYVEHSFVILPFEKEFYARFQYPVDFVGHPLLDVIPEENDPVTRDQFLKAHNLSELPIIALLPGSRRMEIKEMLKQMLLVISHFPNHQFVIAGAPSIPFSFYSNMIKNLQIPVLTGVTYGLLKHSEAALVTSGTATLETALLKTPQVVCYKGDGFSFFIASKIVHVKYISLVNLILDEPLVKELIQNDLNEDHLYQELTRILQEVEVRNRILLGYSRLREKLGGPGASMRASRLMIQYLNKKQVSN